MKKMSGSAGEEVAEVVVAQAEKPVEKAAAPAKVAVSRGRESVVAVSKTWKAQLVDKMELVQAVAAGRLPLSVIEPNMSALTQIARETKNERTVDGVRFFEYVSTTVR